MKKMRNLMNGTEVLKSIVNGCKSNCQFSTCLKKVLFTAAFIMVAIMVNAQSIQQQAEKAGNEAFAGAMVRNIMIIAGVFLVSFMFRSGKKNKENQLPQ